MDSKLTMVDVNYLKWVGQRIIEFGVAKKRIAELEETLGTIILRADDIASRGSADWTRNQRLALQDIHKLAKEILQ